MVMLNLELKKSLFNNYVKKTGLPGKTTGSLNRVATLLGKTWILTI